jgi:hypothetical protein
VAADGDFEGERDGVRYSHFDAVPQRVLASRDSWFPGTATADAFGSSWYRAVNQRSYAPRTEAASARQQT